MNVLRLNDCDHKSHYDVQLLIFHQSALKCNLLIDALQSSSVHFTHHPHPRSHSLRQRCAQAIGDRAPPDLCRQMPCVDPTMDPHGRCLFLAFATTNTREPKTGAVWVFLRGTRTVGKRSHRIVLALESLDQVSFDANAKVTLPKSVGESCGLQEENMELVAFWDNFCINLDTVCVQPVQVQLQCLKLKLVLTGTYSKSVINSHFQFVRHVEHE